MNLQRFKSLKPKPAEVPRDKEAYFEGLAALKPRHKRHLAPIIGTVAASVAVLVIVAVWAVVGRGVRNLGNPTVDTPADPVVEKPVEYEMTEEFKFEVAAFYDQYYLYLLPEFDENKPLAESEIIEYIEGINSPLLSDLVLTCEEFSEFAYDLFGYDMQMAGDKTYNYGNISNYEVLPPDPVSYTVKDDVATVVFDNGGGQITTVTFSQHGKLVLDKLLSLKRTDENDYTSIEDAFDELSQKYRLDLIPAFDEYGQPELTETVHYIWQYLGGDDHTLYTNANGVSCKGLSDLLFTRTVLELFGSYGTNDGFAEFDSATDIDTRSLYHKDGEHFYPLASTDDAKHEVKYVSASVSQFPVHSVVTLNYTVDGDARKLTYISQNGVVPTRFLSCQHGASALADGRDKPLEESMVDIANGYAFHAIHDFEEGTLPHYVRYHVAQFIDKDDMLNAFNANDVMFYGIPLDLYNETVIKYYGKTDMEGKEPIDFNTVESYPEFKRADVVDVNGELYVALEISGGLECTYEFTSVEYGVTASGEDCITASFYCISQGVDYGDSKPLLTTVVFTVEGEMTPKQFISCKTEEQ